MRTRSTGTTLTRQISGWCAERSTTIGRRRVALLAVVLAGLVASSVAVARNQLGPGVSNSTINIAIHMPITGAGLDYGSAGPNAANFYWRWLSDHHQKIAGRDVHLTIADDQFSSSSATQVCTQLASDNLLIIGYQGTPVVTACAAAANHLGIPYFSRGLSPDLGIQNATYFPLSPTYKNEAPIIANWMVQKMGGRGTKVAMFTYNISSFDYIVNRFEGQARYVGLNVIPAERISLTAGPAEIQAAALDLQRKGVQAVYVNMSPTAVFPAFSAWKAAGYSPGVIDYASASQVPTLCSSLGSTSPRPKLYAPSPWPGADLAVKADPNFAKAVAKYTGKPPTDIEVQFWANMQLIGNLLQAAGPKNLSWAGLMKALENQKKPIQTPLLGPVKYTVGNHIDGVHREYMLQANCQKGTLFTFAKTHH
jgi:ABC-type branched-subunit amino acid transport system substrate-binding protein